MISVSLCFTKEVKFFYLQSGFVNYCTSISIQIDTPSKSPSMNVQYFKESRSQPDELCRYSLSSSAEDKSAY